MFRPFFYATLVTAACLVATATWAAERTSADNVQPVPVVKAVYQQQADGQTPVQLVDHRYDGYRPYYRGYGNYYRPYYRGYYNDYRPYYRGYYQPYYRYNSRPYYNYGYPYYGRPGVYFRFGF